MFSKPRKRDSTSKEFEVIQMESAYFQETFLFMFVNNYLGIRN